MKRTRLTLYGIVQGVGCRYFIVRVAGRLGVRGYVKNMPDGSVEVCAEGEENTVDSFLAAIKNGSPAGRVDRVEREEGIPTGEFDSFTVEY
jgi:acylphosphatase